VPPPWSRGSRPSMNTRDEASKAPAQPIPLSFGRTLVIAPHPDDEVLGAGGTIARLAAEGERVFVAIVTEGRARLFGRKRRKSPVGS